MDVVRLYVSSQLLLTVFLVALLWSLYARLHKQLFFWWWAWAWTSFAGFLALTAVALRLAPEWTPLQGSIILGSLVGGFLQVPLLVFGACALRPSGPPARYWLRTGIGLALAASLLSFALAFHWRGQPLTSFTIRMAPRMLALSAALFFCAWILLGRWRRTRSGAAGIIGGFCLLYAIDQSSYTVFCANRLLIGLGATVPQLPCQPPVLQSLLFWLHLLSSCGICFGMVVMLVEEHQRTEGALLECNDRIQAIAASNAALQTEIRERQRAEAERRESEDRYRDLVEHSQDMIVTHDLEGRMLSANPAAARTLGHGVEELLRIPMRESVPPEFRDGFDEYLAKLRKDGIAEGIGFVMTRTGEQRSFEYHSTVRTEGVPFPIVRDICHDVTERRRAEEALRESEDHYRDLVEHSQDLVCTHDLEGRLLSVNPAPARILGYEVEELLRIPMREFLLPEYRHQFDEYLSKIQKDGVADGLVAVRTRTGETRIWEYHNTLRTEGVPFPVVRGMAHDVTERKRAEAALRKSDEKFSKAFRQSPMSLTITSAKDHRYIDVNETYERITGWRREEIIGRTPLDIGLYVDPAQGLELVNRALTERGFRNQEVRFRVRDGSIRIALMSGELIELDGEPCLLNVGADITEYKQVQEALKTSDERFSKAFRQSPVVVTLTSAKDYRYIDVNETFERITGWRRDEVIGRTPFDLKLFVDPAERVELANVVLTEGRSCNREFRMRMKDGSIRVALASSELIEVGGEPCVLSVAADITENKRAQEALRESEDNLRLLLDSTAEVIFGIDLEGRCTFCNPAGLRTLGYERVDELLGKDMHALIHHTRADGTTLCVEECRIRRALRVGEGTHVEDEVLWRADGTSFPAEYWSYPQRRGQAVVGAVITFMDITERKQAAAALRRSEEQLRHAQKMEVIGRMAGGVAHDFNNLLCGINLYLGLALEHVKPADRALLEDLNRALDAARSAGSLTRQLLAVSRRQVAERQVVNINDIVVAASDLLGRLLSENIQVSMKLGQDPGKASLDPLQMQQVVMNLVLNARDAMPEGGQLIIRTANVDLDATPVGEYFISPPRPGPYVVLEVSDTGHGMSEEILPHLFEPFFTTKELGQGTGLGLATAYGIVTQSGGYISAQTVLGHGTTFKVYLPRLDDRLIESPPEMAPARETPAPSGARTVLVVDDTEVVRDAVSKDLRGHGYTVFTASNATEALRISEECKGTIDLLLTDVVMPGMNGPDLVQHFARKRPLTKILYISGYDPAHIAANVRELNSRILLYKPFNSQELLATVSKVLCAQVA